MGLALPIDGVIRKDSDAPAPPMLAISAPHSSASSCSCGRFWKFSSTLLIVWLITLWFIWEQTWLSSIAPSAILCHLRIAHGLTLWPDARAHHVDRHPLLAPRWHLTIDHLPFGKAACMRIGCAVAGAFTSMPRTAIQVWPSSILCPSKR